MESIQITMLSSLSSVKDVFPFTCQMYSNNKVPSKSTYFYKHAHVV